MPTPRLIDAALRDRLGVFGAVVLEGPKGVGKTTTALIHVASAVRFDQSESDRRAAELSPRTLLAGAVPRLLDEWQLVPSLWNAVRAAVDERQQPGQFLLTGSAAPADDITRHRGAGRFGRLRLRPMASVESGNSSGAMSLRALLARSAPDGVASTGHAYETLLDHLCLGGWPRARALGTPAQAATFYRGYLDEIARTDVHGERAGARAAPGRLSRLLRALARSTATRTAATTLAADVGGAAGPIHADTLTADLAALDRVFVTDDVPAWAPALTARARLRSAPVRHFADPALAAALVRATPATLARDPTLVGRLFESMVVRDLRAYADAADAQLYSYRDNTNLEVDIIVEQPGLAWAAFEVKLSTTECDAAARTLLRLAAKVAPHDAGLAAALGVIVPTGAAYRRPDGVWVLPIDTLGA
jgi:uncharacterized protein